MNSYFFAVLAALLLAAAVIWQKRSLMKLHALEFGTDVSGYGALFSLLLLPWVQWTIPFKMYLLLGLQGVVGILAFLFFNKSLRHSDISVVSPLSNLDTITTLYFAAWLLGERMDIRHLLAIACVVGGSIALEYHGRKEGSVSRRALFLIGGSMLLYGLLKVLGKIVLSEVPVLTAIFFIHLFYFTGFIVLDYVFHQENISQLRRQLKQPEPQVFVTSLLYFLYRAAMTFAISSGSVTLATALTRISTLVSAGVGGSLFGDKALMRRLVASVFIVAGALLILLLP